MIPHPADITDFLTALARQEIAPRTRRNYGDDVRRFGHWFSATTGEPFTAKAVTPTDLRDYRGALRTNERRAAATVNRRLAALRAFFRWAKATGRCQELPTETVKGIPATPRVPKALAKREVDRLVREAEQAGKKRNLAIVQLLRHTGMRVGELCNLRLANLTITERKGQVIVRAGKGNKDRTLPLNNDVRLAVSAYLAVRPASAEASVFLGQRGDPLQAQAVQNLVRRLASRAGLPLTTPHVLRHTFAKNLLDAGVDLATVSRLLGHERLETTAIYTQPTVRDLENAVQRLEADADRH